jgi:hypothetical protein
MRKEAVTYIVQNSGKAKLPMVILRHGATATLTVGLKSVIYTVRHFSDQRSNTQGVLKS